jgi:cobalt/nickel transport system permease protein
MQVETVAESCADKGGFAQRVDSRAKIVFCLVCLTLVVASSGLLVPLIAGVLGLALTLSSGVRPRSVALRMSEPLFFAFILALFQAFITGGAPVWGITVLGHNMPVSLAGLHKGTLILARVFGGAGVVLFLSMTTPAHRLLSAAAHLKFPRGLVELSLFAYRYVFVLMEDALTVYQAQRGRLGYSGFGRGLKSLGVLAGSVFLRAYAQAEATGQAMSMRGYTGEYIPVYRERLHVSDAALLCLMLAPCLAAYLWTL